MTQAASTFFYDVHIYGRAGQVMLRGWDWSHFEIEVVSRTVKAYAQPTVVRRATKLITSLRCLCLS